MAKASLYSVPKSKKRLTIRFLLRLNGLALELAVDVIHGELVGVGGRAATLNSTATGGRDRGQTRWRQTFGRFEAAFGP